MKNLKLSTITLAAVMLSSTIIMSISNANGQTPASSWTPPTNGTFVCWNLADTDCWWMLPYPGPTCDDCGVYYLGTTNGVSWYGFYDSNCLARADQGLHPVADYPAAGGPLKGRAEPSRRADRVQAHFVSGP